jgi:arsenate reductase (thioredoxin)
MSDAPHRPFNVLFLCTGNSARSIMAEALLNKLGRHKFTAFSAGSFPKGHVNPYALTIVEHLGFDTSDFRSKSWDEFAQPGAPALDFVFTVCDDAAGETCPVWPGQPISAHWGIPDPAAATGTPTELALAFAEACRQLRNRISLFVELPVASLDRTSLQARLRDIGRTSDAPADQAAG